MTDAELYCVFAKGFVLFMSVASMNINQRRLQTTRGNTADRMLI